MPVRCDSKRCNTGVPGPKRHLISDQPSCLGDIIPHTPQPWFLHLRTKNGCHAALSRRKVELWEESFPRLRCTVYCLSNRTHSPEDKQEAISTLEIPSLCLLPYKGAHQTTDHPSKDAPALHSKDSRWKVRKNHAGPNLQVSLSSGSKCAAGSSLSKA